MISILNQGVVQAAGITPITSDQTLWGLFITAMNTMVLPVLGVVCVGAIVYSGIMFVSSQGDPEKLKTARSALTWAIVGVVLIALSYSIVVTFSTVIQKSILK